MDTSLTFIYSLTNLSLKDNLIKSLTSARLVTNSSAVYLAVTAFTAS